MAKNKLDSARNLILGSSIFSVIVTVFAAWFTGDWLFLVAGVLFLGSGIAGIFVVRSLSDKMDAR